jgi:hypothetical protein
MKKQYKILILILATIIIIPIAYFIFTITIAHDYIDGTSENLLFDEDIIYYKSIVSYVEENSSDEVDFNNVFKFDWDKAFIVKSYSGEDEEFYNNIDSEEVLPTFEKRDGIKCIVFLKSNKIVFEYRYITEDIKFLPGAKFFTKNNAIFQVAEKGGFFSKKIVLQLKE